jgi:hypothetical protein
MKPDPEPHLPADAVRGNDLPPTQPAGGMTEDRSAPPLLNDLVRGSASEEPGNARSLRRFLAGFLSVCLALYLLDAVLSVLGLSLALVLGVRVLASISGIISLLALLMGLVVYGLMGLTPLIPKRLFLPVALFNPVAVLCFIPVLIYGYRWIEPASGLIALGQLALGLAIVHRLQGGFRLRWPLVAESRLGSRAFSGLNLCAFLMVNLFVLVPATAAYLVSCAALAIQHSSAGFLALRPSGFSVQVRKYVRDDGKTILLVPMAHVGEADFYRQLSRSFPTNSLVLMEGVTDDKNLLTNRISYKRMARTLGLSEQQKEFKPVEVETVRADVDVSQFTTNTIGMLNLVMLVHGKGLTPETLSALLGFAAPPDLEQQVLEDILRKRNQRVLQEIHDRLSGSKPIVVPWGVAHMPGIAAGITAAGFRVAEAQDYVVIRFHSRKAITNSQPGPGPHNKPPAAS